MHVPLASRASIVRNKINAGSNNQLFTCLKIQASFSYAYLLRKTYRAIMALQIKKAVIKK